MDTFFLYSIFRFVKIYVKLIFIPIKRLRVDLIFVLKIKCTELLKVVDRVVQLIFFFAKVKEQNPKDPKIILSTFIAQLKISNC